MEIIIILEIKKKLKFNFSKICPLNSYSRKNIGYLVSIQNGNETIIETDDDNYPKNNFLKFLDLKHEVNEIREVGWINVYKKFTKKFKHLAQRFAAE